LRTYPRNLLYRKRSLLSEKILRRENSLLLLIHLGLTVNLIQILKMKRIIKRVVKGRKNSFLMKKKIKKSRHLPNLAGRLKKRRISL
jgi:hypothetical protein